MCFSRYILFFVLLVPSCGSNKKLGEIMDGREQVGLFLPNDESMDDSETSENFIIDSSETSNSSESIIMNAVKDSETGEMVAMDIISASKVVARFRNIAERFGKIAIEFDISVPSGMIDSRWQLKFFPKLEYLNEKLELDPIYITGSKYRNQQLLGYKRYEALHNEVRTHI